jgi:hypothetical protein
MINRIRLYLPEEQPRDEWTEWSERVAADLARDAKAVEDGEMSVEQFDEKW